jgi:hypothetical protein
MAYRAILAVFLVVFYSPAYGQQQQQMNINASPNTEDEKSHAQKHSKLSQLNSLSSHDLRRAAQASPGHHAGARLGVPSMALSPNGPKTPEEWLQDIVCQSDLVVLGNVSKQVSSLTENGGLVFSDYYFHISNVLYAKEPYKSKIAVLVLPGGRIKTPDGVLETHFEALSGVPVGGPPYHLLFLRRIKEDGMSPDSFFLTNLNGALYLAPDHVVNFSSIGQERQKLLFGTMTRDQMIAKIKTAAAACRGAK